MAGKKEVLALECSGPGCLKMVRFPKPETADDCVLLRIKMCGICGTDLHGIEGRRTVNYPFIPGHEVVGVVESMGKNAGRSVRTFGGTGFTEGDRVSVNPRIVCGRCYYCRNLPGHPEMCTGARTGTSTGSRQPPHLFGGLAEYMYLLAGSEIITLPEELPDELAVLAEPYACAVGCIDRYQGKYDWVRGEAPGIMGTIVVYGAGAIGMLMTAGFHLAGAKQVIVIDPAKDRLDLVRKFGASHTMNAASTSAEERIARIRELTGGVGSDAVIEACGVPSAITEGIQVLRRGGKFFEVGHLVNAGSAQIDPQYVCRNEIEILGHYAYPSSQCMVRAAGLLARRELPYQELVRVFSFSRFEDVICGKKTGGAVKPVLDMTM